MQESRAVESGGLAVELDALLLEAECGDLRKLVMTDEEYRTFRYEAAVRVLENIGIARSLLEAIGPEKVLYWGIERAVQEFWQRDPELVFRGDLSGLPDCVQDIFRPVLILPSKDHRTPVDRENGKIELPDQVQGKLDITERLLRAPILRSEAESLASERAGLGLSGGDVMDLEETLGGIWTQNQIQAHRNNHGASHLRETHHMLSVHSGDASCLGDEIQIPLPTVMHLFMHVSYCRTAFALMDRIERSQGYQQGQTKEEFSKTLSPELSEIYRQAQIEYAQNAQSANAIRNSHAREYRDVEIQARFANIESQIELETSNNRLKSILQNPAHLSNDDVAYLESLIPTGYRPSIRDIVSGSVCVDETLAAYCKLHGFQHLVPNVYYPARTAFEELPEEVREFLFEQALEADPDDNDSDTEHLADWLGSRYLQDLFEGDADRIESHQTSTPVCVINARREATDRFLGTLESEVYQILAESGLEDSSPYVDQLILLCSGWFNLGLYNVAEAFEPSGLENLRNVLPETLKSRAEEFAGRFYREGLAQHHFQREQLLNLEGAFGEEYRVPGVEKVAEVFAQTIEAGKRVSATFDKCDADGILSAATIDSIWRALTGQSLEVFTGSDSGEHSLTLRSLLDLIHEETGLVFILDRGSGAQDAQVIERLFKGINSPDELLSYSVEYAEVLGTGGIGRIESLVRSLNAKVRRNSSLDWKKAVVEQFSDLSSFPHLRDYLYGLSDPNFKLCIVDHHEVSPEMDAILKTYAERIVFVNPCHKEGFSHNYSAATICHQIAIEVGKTYPEFSLSGDAQHQAWERVSGLIISDLQSRLTGIGVSFDLNGDLREQFIEARRKSRNVTRATALKHVQAGIAASLDSLQESGKITPAECRFFESRFQPGRHPDQCGNFVENTRCWAAISTTTDVMSVMNPWTRAIYQTVLDKSEDRQPYGYGRLQSAAASAGDDEKSPRMSSFAWDSSYAIGFMIGPVINAALRERLSEQQLLDIFHFLTYPVESNDAVSSGRRLLIRAGKSRFENNERSRRDAEVSHRDWGSVKYPGRLMVAKVSGSSRTGLAAQHLVELGDRERPALVIKELGGGMFSASIRAPGGNLSFADLIDEMRRDGLIERGGGHRSACGFFAAGKDLDKIVEFINKKLIDYRAKSTESIAIDLATLPHDDTRLNIFQVTEQASVQVGRALEPYGVDVPVMSFVDNFEVTSISGRQRASNNSEYITIKLKDANGNLQEVRVFDPVIINQLMDIYSSALNFPPIRLQFSWRHRKSSLSAGFGHIEVQAEGIRQNVLREEESRASMVVERCLGTISPEC